MIGRWFIAWISGLGGAPPEPVRPSGGGL